MVERVTLAATAVSDVRDYWLLLKPRVMSLVVFSAAAGLYLAPGTLHPVMALVAILCIATAAGASAAINNGYDADIDRLMARTRSRPTAIGRIRPDDAIAFGITLAGMAVMVMGLAVNWVAAALLASTVAFYVLVYTMWLKRRTPQNIVIGGAAGALPPMVGWAAASAEVSLASISLFAIIFVWTPPHFWALSLHRADDYARVGVPMLPVVAGAATTRRHILAYVLLLLPVSLLPLVVGLSGPFYGVVALALGAGFVVSALGLFGDQSEGRAMRTFRYSIIHLFGLFLALVLDQALLRGGFGW